MDCIFCKIVKGEIPCAKLAETAQSLAFLDIMPLNKGHALVIPKKHAENVLDISEDEMADIGRLVHKLASAIKKATGAVGLNLIQNNGKAAHQFVMHFHMHIIPRFSNDSFGFNWNPGKYEEGEMQQMQKKILDRI